LRHIKALRFFGLCASLHHVPEASGTPEDSSPHLRDFPLPVRLHQRSVYDSARNKKVVQLVSVGFTALPHMHGDEIGPDVRRTAVERNIVTGYKVLRTFKRVKLFSWLALISSGPISDAPLGRVTFA
jgi:hypothetical protein